MGSTFGVPALITNPRLGSRQPSGTTGTDDDDGDGNEEIWCLDRTNKGFEVRD